MTGPSIAGITPIRWPRNVPQVAQWLEALGMAEYAGRFMENRIDFSVLRELTDQDLKDLGMVLGDRRKLLRSTGATGYAPWYFSVLAHAHAELGQFDEARRCMSEALSTMAATGERWCEADVQRRAGEIERLADRQA
jgi:uncharacterized protein YjiS (DUF1127 family)